MCLVISFSGEFCAIGYGWDATIRSHTLLAHTHPIFAYLLSTTSFLLRKHIDAIRMTDFAAFSEALGVLTGGFDSVHLYFR